MEIKFNLNSFHSAIIKKLSDYSELPPEFICSTLVKNFLEEMDTSIHENLKMNLKMNLGDGYFDDYSGRYIE